MEQELYREIVAVLLQIGKPLVVPRRYGPHRGGGHRPQSSSRMRLKELLEGESLFGRSLFKQRLQIEQHFRYLTSWGVVPTVSRRGLALIDASIVGSKSNSF